MEMQNIEYKEIWKDEYLKWICGFANAQGGKIYVGVEDSGKPVGLDHPKTLLEDIPNKIATTMGIVADVNLLEQDGLSYIEISVSPSNLPIAYHGVFYYRSGATKQELRGTALQDFLLKKMGRSWDDVTMHNATIDCIDRESIDYFLKKGIKAERIAPEEEGNSTETVLSNLGLIDENGNLKNAAILLFAKRPQQYFTGVEFKIGKFGKDETDLRIQDSIEGNLIHMADEVVKILKSYYLTRPIHYEGMQRVEPLEVPINALREILYNAIAHKDYSGVHTQMRVYDDRVELWNDGALPDGVTQDTLMKEHSSRPRNKNIAYAMFKAGFIEVWGRGWKKICDEFSAVGLPIPTIESVQGGTKVCFKRPTNVGSLSEDVGSSVGSLESAKLTDRQKNICKMLIINPHVSAKAMSEVLSVVPRTIERELSSMQKAGVIRHEGKTSGGKWVVLIALE